MTSGALMQLVAQGAQDQELYGSEGTFLKKFHRAAAYSTQTVPLDVPALDAIYGQTVRVPIAKYGDLLSRVYVEVLVKKLGMTYFPGEELLEEISYTIGGQTIEKHTNEWLRIRNELFQTGDEARAYRHLTDFTADEADGTLKRLWVPLAFFFCQPGKTLPIISITEHGVEIQITFASSVRGLDPAFKPQVRVWAEFVFLDTAERKLVMSAKHRILFEQLFIDEDRVALSDSSMVSLNTTLYARNPCKYIAWTTTAPGTFAEFTAGVLGDAEDAAGLMSDACITLNAHDRSPRAPSSYFTSLQPYVYNKTTPCAGIGFFSFCDAPGDTGQPSGSVNLSRIGTTILSQTYRRINPSATETSDLASDQETLAGAARFTRVKVYSVVWNFLRIEDGNAGVAYPS